MPQLARITRDPTVMGGKLGALQAEDVSEALPYAAWRAQEVEVPLSRRQR